MKYRDWSISLKLIVIMVVIGVFAAGGIGTISGVIAKKAIDTNMEEHYSSIRDIRSENMTEFYSSVIKAADTLAGTSDVEHFTADLVAYHVREEVQADDPFPAKGEEYNHLWTEGEKLEDLKTAYGYYDVFVICKAHGHVMYSVGKNTDLGENVRVGGLRESGLGKCWSGVIESGKPFITDFEPYGPKDNEPTQFVGAPINIQGEFKHVFVVQVPLNQVDALMQSNSGMGETGETYFVGPDHTLRNNSRIQATKNNPSTILSLTADQDYVAAALSGESGFTTHAKNYEGMDVLSAYSGFTLPESELRWAMVAEITKAEAYQPIQAMVFWIVGSVLLISAMIVAVALVFGRSLGNPLSKLARSCGIMAEGDFTESITTAESKDEIGQMLRGFKEMQENTANLIKQVGDAAANLASSSEQLSANADETGRAVQDVARTVEEVAKGSAETNSNVENVAAAIVEAASQGEEGKRFATQTNEIMQRATGSIDSTASVISALGEKTAQIEEFIGIITGIADQTNLLALNAAIEAARAGEAGRGFAVVAEEVRKLAEESNNAAGNITQMIHGIKSEMQVALDAMDSSKGEVTEGATMVLQTSEMLGEIVEGVSKLSSQVDTIAAIATENSAAAEEVSSTTEEQTASMEEIGANSNTLAKLASDLSGMVDKFKV